MSHIGEHKFDFNQRVQLSGDTQWMTRNYPQLVGKPLVVLSISWYACRHYRPGYCMVSYCVLDADLMQCECDEEVWISECNLIPYVGEKHASTN